MEKFEVFTGVGAPLRRSNVDTDQIIPAVYLKRITKTGFEDALFAAWRNDPDFVLNQEPYKNAEVLVAGPDFGTGSRFKSRARRLGTSRLWLQVCFVFEVRRHLPRQLGQAGFGHR